MFRRDLSDSAFSFINIVWPIIKKEWFQNCEIRSVEVETKIEFAKELDIFAGIDAWVLNTKKGMRGLASRIQWGKDWNSFTIRKERHNGSETEFKKRLYAIENNWAFPYYTVQAYITKRGNNGILLNVAKCRTKDLILYIKNGKKGIHYKIKSTKNASFYIIHWDNSHISFDLNILNKKNQQINERPTPKIKHEPKMKMEVFF